MIVYSDTKLFINGLRLSTFTRHDSFSQHGALPSTRDDVTLYGVQSGCRGKVRVRRDSDNGIKSLP